MHGRPPAASDTHVDYDVGFYNGKLLLHDAKYRRCLFRQRPEKGNAFPLRIKTHVAVLNPSPLKFSTSTPRSTDGFEIAYHSRTRLYTTHLVIARYRPYLLLSGQYRSSGDPRQTAMVLRVPCRSGIGNVVLTFATDWDAAFA